MGFGAAASTAFRKYATFIGRARRSEFWWFTLFLAIVSLIAGLLDAGIGADVSDGTGPVQLLVSLALLLPNIAVTVRRLHDTDRSGWLFLVTLIPLIGWIFWIIWCVKDSDPGSNRFGFSPKDTSPWATW